MKNKSSFNYNSVFKILSKGRVSLVVCGILAASGAWAVPGFTAPTDVSLKNITNATPGTTNIATSGTATYSGINIAQTTANAIIDWNKFNIASGEGLNFTGGNATLNRISGGASSIAGTIRGDHALFFVNPNGIVVSGSMIAPTIVLSTLDISNSDFNAGNYKFTRGSSTAAITNSGTIGDGGLAGNIGVAALFATTVTNTGTIASNNVAIVAADAVTLGATTSNTTTGNYDFTANGYNGVSAITASTAATSITNTNTINAQDNGGNAGNIDIYSTKGTITNIYNIESLGQLNTGAVTIKASGDITNTNSIDSNAWGSSGNAGVVTVESTSGSVINNEGGIYSRSYAGAGAVSVTAYKDVQNFYGGIYSTGYTGAGAVSVTATNGIIDNGEGTIKSQTSTSGASGSITLQSHGDINNLYGQIFTNAQAFSGNSGAISITSDAGSLNNHSSSIYSKSNHGASGDITINVAKNIDNSNGGIYSQAIGTGSNGGAVSLRAGGTIDLTNSTSVYSTSMSGNAGDTLISAPHLLFSSNSYIGDGTVTLNVDTINNLDAKQLNASDTVIFPSNVFNGNTPTITNFSNTAQGMVLGTPSAYPLLDQIVSGGVTITGTTAMTVAQSTANAIINWSDFSVALNNSVNFLGGNATLNRVTTTNPSVIAGSVTSDHALFFVNPNGIVATGTMTAPTLVLSTLSISDANFNAGAYNFTGGNSAGSIINYGTLGDGGIASGSNNAGVVALFAPNIANSGQITSHSVALVAADSVTLGATTSNVNGSGNYDQTANGYTGVSGIGATTVATSIVNNNASVLAQVYGTIDTGPIDIISKNGDIQNHSGTIKADGQTSNSGSGAVTVHASGDIQNYSGTIEANSYDTQSSGTVSIISDNGNINNAEAYIDSASNGSGNAGSVTLAATHGAINNNYGNIYSGAYGSGNTGDVSLQAASDISNIEGYIYTSSSNGTGNAGAISVISDNGNINNMYGNIYSNSNWNSIGATASAITIKAGGAITELGQVYSEGDISGAITVNAVGDITQISNSMYSEANTGSSGDISVTSVQGNIYGNQNIYSSSSSGNSGAAELVATKGNITLDGRNIYSQANGSGSSGAVSVHANGDVNILNYYYVYSQSFSGTAGAVSVASDTGAVVNHGSIYSQSNNGASGDVTVLAKTGIDNSNGSMGMGEIYSIGATQSGNVLVKTTGGSLDLTNGGHIYSINNQTGSVGDVTLYAPEVTYTTNDVATAKNINASYVVSEGFNNPDYTHGKININANTINGEAVTSATLASTADSTKYWDRDGNMYNFFGTITKTALPQLAVTAQQAPQDKVIQKIQDVISAIDTKTNTLQTINPQSKDIGSPMGNQGATTKNGKMFEDATAGNGASEQTSANEGTSPSANNTFVGQVRFTVGHDITGGGNAIAHSTMIPGVFVVSAQQ